ncbi:MAG: NirD/YgiW/YdeI family stress tolerance protein, partial [Alphaproteobacteria bacterium]|nr:NirD/YgiW/YdeI family stress tolerance protein [Alphaproteobacteria bacterium]
VFILLTAVPVFAGQQQTINSNIQNIVDIVNYADDMPVKLQGKIVQYLGDEKYIFEDGSGSIIIELSDSIVDKMDLTTQDIVTIHGHVDKGDISNEIDVYTIEK